MATVRYVLYMVILASFSIIFIFTGMYIHAVRANGGLWMSSSLSSGGSWHFFNKQSTETKVSWPALTTLRQQGGNYPVYQPLSQILENWNPDIADSPTEITEVLQHFNYGDEKEREMALAYRTAELPFKLYNVSEFDHVASKWTDQYLIKEFKKLSTMQYSLQPHIEKSAKSNHFLFWNERKVKKRKVSASYVPPTEVLEHEKMAFDEWLGLAQAAEAKKLAPTSDHYYFSISTLKPTTLSKRAQKRAAKIEMKRLEAAAHEHSNDTSYKMRDIGSEMDALHELERGHSFITRDLPGFSSGEENFFITAPTLNKGIQCRFGMRGIISEAHYDAGRNMIAMIRGEKRYILTPPEECPNLDIIADKHHPSFRHSIVDWSDPKQVRSSIGSKHDFSKVKALETVVRAGEVLYLPSFWFHYITSLGTTIQCNSRSGPPPNNEGEAVIEKCLDRKKQDKDATIQSLQEKTGKDHNLRGGKLTKKDMYRDRDGNLKKKVRVADVDAALSQAARRGMRKPRPGSPGGGDGFRQVPPRDNPVVTDTNDDGSEGEGGNEERIYKQERRRGKRGKRGKGQGKRGKGKAKGKRNGKRGKGKAKGKRNGKRGGRHKHKLGD